VQSLTSNAFFGLDDLVISILSLIHHHCKKREATISLSSSSSLCVTHQELFRRNLENAIGVALAIILDLFSKTLA